MLELDDNDLRAIAESRVNRERWYILSVVLFGLSIFCLVGYLFAVDWASANVVWALLGVIGVWLACVLPSWWHRKKGILKKLREENSEIIKG